MVSYYLPIDDIADLIKYLFGHCSFTNAQSVGIGNVGRGLRDPALRRLRLLELAKGQVWLGYCICLARLGGRRTGQVTPME